MEGLGLGLFMVSAGLFGTLLEYPGQGHGFVGGAVTLARTKSVEFLTSILESRHV